MTVEWEGGAHVADRVATAVAGYVAAALERRREDEIRRRIHCGRRDGFGDRLTVQREREFVRERRRDGGRVVKSQVQIDEAGLRRPEFG